MEQSNIFFVIVTYNAMPWVDRCLESALNGTKSAEIVVVDNVSKDNTVEYIKANYPQVHLFPQTENLGFGAANNLGIRYALEQGADFVYLLNEDAWIEKNTLEILINVMQKNPDYGVISPLQITAVGDKLDRNFGRALVRRGDNVEQILSDLSLNKPQQVYSFPFFQAAHWFISRECIEKVGYFSPVFKHYGEDNEYLRRVIFHGFKTGVTPLTKAVHDRAYRSNDNWGSNMFFVFNSYLGKATNVNRKGLKHLLDLLIYSIVAFVYRILISIFFVFVNDNRKYMKNIPSPFRIEKFNIIHKSVHSYKA